MTDIPKPLPRTKIPLQPVRTIQNKTDHIICRSNTNDNLEIQTLNVPKLEKTLISEQAEIKKKIEFSFFENAHSNEYAEIPLATMLKSNEKKETEERDKNKNTFSNKITSIPMKIDKEITSNNDILDGNNNNDNDDDVIDEILKYKTVIQEKKLIENDNLEINEVSLGRSETIPSVKKENDQNLGLLPKNDENLLGVHIHRSDCLKMYRIIRHPSVVIHIANIENNGTYLEKSKPDKNVTYNQESSSFILPVITKPFNFKHNKSIIPVWDETLAFNENTSYIVKPSTILFFEIVDFIDSSNVDAEYASVGWHHIAWAFLKPFRNNNNSNLEKILRLQLYHADSKTYSISTSNVPCVYNWYRKKHWKLYPSTLYVTLKNIFSYKIDNKPRQRSYTPFQAEIGSDASVKSLTIFSSDGEDNSDLQTNMSALYRLSEIEWSRLPGQSCYIPNVKIASLHPDPKGCLAVKFSNSGIFLACGTCTDIFIYAVDGILERRLTSHQGLIYTLCWFSDDSLLLSASADCTVCVWDMKSANENPLQILPHPSFVYCSTFIFPENTIATGCYDGIVRIWWQEHACSKFWQLHQELTGHKQYVNTLCSFRSKEFFSGDSVGLIIHWTVNEYGRWFKLNEIKLSEIQGIIINKLIPFPGNKRLLIHTRDSLLRTMDVKTSVIIQWYQGNLNDNFQCSSALTPCGSFVFSISEDSTVNVWESNTGKQVAFYSSRSLVSGCGGTIDFHPFDHIFTFSFYSVGCNSSAVNLLKYSQNVSGNSDITLYLLQENAFSKFEYDYY